MFIWSAIAHLVAVTSPGPDTALIIRQVARKGRLSGYYAALGIGVGVFIHSVFASSGISLLILSDSNFKFILSLVGALYLIYLGISSFLSTKGSTNNAYVIHDKSSFLKGLLTNIFNIKALIFFVSLFTIITDSSNGIYLLIYPIYFGAMTTLWFCFLSYILTTPQLNNSFTKNNKLIENLSASFLIIIGLFIIYNITYVN